MNSEEGEINLICPKHCEKIISVQLIEIGENKMFCLKCLTASQVPIDQLSQQLKDIRQKRVQILRGQGIQSENRLGQLKKIFIAIKDLFNEQADEILAAINDRIHSLRNKIKSETQLLEQSIQSMNLKEVNHQITELKKQQLQYEDQFIIQDGKLRNNIIHSYLNLIKSINKVIKEASEWKNQKNIQILNKVVINKITPLVQKNVQGFGKQFYFKTLIQEKGMYKCYSMILEKGEQILVNGQHKNIQINDIQSDGTVNLKQTLNEHTNSVTCLCFSKKQYWFISGSMDNTMRMWCKIFNDWICKQIFQEAHKDWVTGMELNNTEDQLISCSRDQTLKVWRKKQNEIFWECFQIMSQPTHGVHFLSLNPSCNLLASSEFDKLRVWSIQKDQLWIQKQVIYDINNDYYLRVKFTEDSELIASTCKRGRLLRLTLNNKGLFQVCTEFLFDEIEEQQIYFFPIIYNQNNGLFIVRLNHLSTFMLKKQPDGQFILLQVLNGDFQAGEMTKTYKRKYLIIQNNYTKQLTILK